MKISKTNIKTNYKKVTMTFDNINTLDDVVSYVRYIRTDFQIGTSEKTLILKNISPWFTHKIIAYVNDIHPKAFVNCFMVKDKLTKKEIENAKTNNNIDDRI